MCFNKEEVYEIIKAEVLEDVNSAIKSLNKSIIYHNNKLSEEIKKLEIALKAKDCNHEWESNGPSIDFLSCTCKKCKWVRWY